MFSFSFLLVFVLRSSSLPRPRAISVWLMKGTSLHHFPRRKTKRKDDREKFRSVSHFNSDVGNDLGCPNPAAAPHLPEPTWQVLLSESAFSLSSFSSILRLILRRGVSLQKAGSRAASEGSVRSQNKREKLKNTGINSICAKAMLPVAARAKTKGALCGPE